MTIEEWAKDFKSYVNALDMPRDDYNGIMEYIDDATSMLKEQGKWISVKDRLPPERDSIFSKVYGTKQWNPNMFQRSSDDMRVVVQFEDGTRMVSHDHTVDGKWNSEICKYVYPKRTVTHWMENPELPEET